MIEIALLIMAQREKERAAAKLLLSAALFTLLAVGGVVYWIQ